MTKSNSDITKVKGQSINGRAINHRGRRCLWWWMMMTTTTTMISVMHSPLLVVVASELPKVSVKTSSSSSFLRKTSTDSDANSFDVGGHYMARVLPNNKAIDDVNDNDGDDENQRKLPERIVGGTPVNSRSEYPWYGIPLGGSLCGASLISPDIMISAAHCAGAFGSGIRIGIGMTDRKSNNYLDYVPIKRSLIHSEYNQGTYENDIMLIQLERPVNTTIIPLVSYNMNPLIPESNVTVRAIGFGTTREGGAVSTSLQQVDIIFF